MALARLSPEVQAGAEDNMNATGAIGRQPWAKRRAALMQPVLGKEEALLLCRL